VFWKKRCAIVFACDGDYSVGVALAMMGINQYSPSLCNDYVIFHDNWKSADFKAIRTLSSNVSFIEFKKCDFLNRNSGLINKGMSWFIDRWGHYKYVFPEVLRLLKKYKKVIFFDTDLAIVSDISGLLKYRSIAWRDGVASTEHRGHSINRPNAGVIVFNDSIPYAQMADLYIEYCRDADGWDEIALARLAHDLHVKVHPLDHRFNVVPRTLGRIPTKNIAIFHTAGRDKVWNSDIYRHVIPEYYSFLHHYQTIRGDRKSVPNVRDKQLLDAFYMRKNIPLADKVVKLSPSHIRLKLSSLISNRVVFTVDGYTTKQRYYRFHHDGSLDPRFSYVEYDQTVAGRMKADPNLLYRHVERNGATVFSMPLKPENLIAVERMFSFFEGFYQTQQTVIGQAKEVADVPLLHGTPTTGD